MKTAAIIMARMGSSRLPAKVLLSLGEYTALQSLVKRLSYCKGLDEIIIATSVSKLDDVIEREAEMYGVKCFRGNERMVIKRAVDAALANDVDTIVDITSDCPMADPAHVDRLIVNYKAGGYDYVSNDVYARSWPDGLDIQVFSLEALEKAMLAIEDPNHYSHFGWNIGTYSHKTGAKCLNIPAPEEYNWPDLRITLDTIEDYRFIYMLWRKFAKEQGLSFRAEDVIDYVREHPELITNKEITQKVRGTG